MKQLYDCYQSELSSIDKLNTPRIKRNISKIPSLIANLENKPKTKIYNKPKATISSAELDASKREAELEKLKRINLELKFAALEAKQKEQ